MLDDSMLTADQAMRLVGHDPDKARRALASGRAWTPEQAAQLRALTTPAPTPPAPTPAPATPVWSALALQEPEPATQPTTMEEDKPTRRRGRARTALAITAGLILAVGAGAGSWTLLTRPATPPAPQATPTATQAAAAPQGVAQRVGNASWICDTTGTGVTCWGADPDAGTQPPTPITGMEEVTISHLAVGKGFAVATDTAGGVWAWGATDHGQLGPDAAPDTPTTAVKVGDLPEPATALTAGAEHACAATSTGVWCLGSNRVGQVTGTPTSDPQPLTQVDGVPGATSLGTSGYDTWATTDQGTWAWGSNQWGQTNPAEPGTATTPHQDGQ